MVEVISAKEHMNDFLLLLEEYTNSIKSGNDEVSRVLEHQNLDEELIRPEMKYDPPRGRMFLAYADGNLAGCVALAGSETDYCEVKRLYVRPEFRGQHIAQTLLEQTISAAKEIGYKAVRLDTFPFMKGAISLYEKLGFSYIDRYNENPADSAIYMQLNLN